MERLHAVSAALMFAVLGARAFAAGELEIPPGAVGEKTQMVFWADGTQITAAKLDTLEKSVKDMIPEPERAASHKRFEAAKKAITGFVAAGGEVLVVSSKEVGASSPQEAPMAPAGEAPAADVQTNPPVKEKTVAMIKLKAGATPEGVSGKLKTLIAELEKEYPDEFKKSDTPEFELKDAGGGWAYVVSKDTEKPFEKPDAAGAAVFKEAMAQQTGAVMRVAFRITEDSKKKLAEEPAPMLFGDIMAKVRSIKSVSAGAFPAENSRIDLQIVFDDEAGATGFKASLDKLVLGFGQMMLMGPGGEGAGADAEKQAAALKAVLAPFLLTQKGAVLRTSIDVEQAKKIHKLGEQANPRPGAAPAPDAPATSPPME